MATEKQILAYEVTLESAKAEGSVGKFKTELREANNALQYMTAQFGEASVEAQIAAKKVAGLKDAIGDAKALAETFNPDKKFVALGGALQGAVAGFSALQGAMGLLGSESKDVEKMLLKVQSAMALQQGISGIFDSIDSFKLLGNQLMQFSIIQKIVTAGQRLFNAVMSANPIGLLIAAITALIAAGTALFIFFKNSAAAAKENEDAVKAHTKALDDHITAREKASKQLKVSNEQEIAMAKATGQTTKAIRALELQLAQKSLEDIVGARNAALHTVELEKQLLASLKLKDASEEVIKAQLTTTNKAIADYTKLNEGVQTALDERTKIRNAETVAIATEKTAEINKQKELAKKVKGILQQDIIDKEKASIEGAGIDIKAQEEKNKQDELLAKSKVTIDNKAANAVMEQTKLSALQESDLKKKYKDIDDADTKALLQAKIKATADSLSIIGDIMGQESAAGKAVAISSALINTYQGITAALAAPFPASIPAVIAAAATGFKAVKSIIATKVPGGGGGSASIPSMGSMEAPIKPQAQTTTLSTSSINQIGVASSRAFVLESDVTNNQERIQRLNRAARINTILILVMSFITSIN
jgi:hypothetical protein